jgi:hypothetical protein
MNIQWSVTVSDGVHSFTNDRTPSRGSLKMEMQEEAPQSLRPFPHPSRRKAEDPCRHLRLPPLGKVVQSTPRAPHYLAQSGTVVALEVGPPALKLRQTTR